jgi:hypothetical protein
LKEECHFLREDYSGRTGASPTPKLEQAMNGSLAACLGKVCVAGFDSDLAALICSEACFLMARLSCAVLSYSAPSLSGVNIKARARALPVVLAARSI